MADDYASHLPVLEAVCQLVKPRSVLEFGGGLHSTPFLLSLPIERLICVETGPDWLERITEEISDPKLHLRPNAKDLERGDLAGFDLVFIDDGASRDERDHTIRWVLGQQHPPTVIHDAEVYATVIDEFTSEYAVIPTQPETAVVW